MDDQSDKDFRQAVAAFVGAFEIVFRYDWKYTKSMVGDEAPGANFIEPGLEDEVEDWGARGALLDRYRTLVGLMKDRGMEPVFPFPLDGLPDFTGRVW